MPFLASLNRAAYAALNPPLRERGYSLTWLPPRVVRDGSQLEVTFAMLAAQLMLTTPRPYFIGIGANDGITHDPLYPFIRDHGWRGVMVEPIPEAFAALRRNYAAYPDVALVQAAIGVEDGTSTIYSTAVSDQDQKSLQMTLHSSFSRDTLLKAREWYPDLETRIIERSVPVMSFATLAGTTTADVLKIDTEGYDLAILKTIDLSSLAAKLIIAEHAHLTRDGKVEMADILLDHGYRVCMNSLDMLGYRQ
jgi:FkbM family methyltransferase